MQNIRPEGVGLERRWRHLVEGLDAIVWEADARTLSLTAVSERAERLLGYPLERWLGEQELGDRLESVRDGSERRSDFRLPTAEGLSLWFHEVVTLDGVALRGTMIDVTALREASRTHETGDPGVAVRVGGEIIDRVDAAVIATAPDGSITYWNQHAERTYGHSRDAAVDTPLQNLLIPPTDRDRIANAIFEAAGGTGWEMEVTACHRDGRPLKRWVKAAPLREEAGEVVGMVWMSVDAAQSPATQRALAVSEAVKDGILQSSLDCIVMMDPSGRVVDFNPAAERVFQRRREEVVGKELGELIIPERLREAHRKALERHKATGRSELIGRRVEVQAMKPDGSEFPAELTITRIDAGGATMFAGFVRDLTERRSAEERMAHLATRDQLTGLPNRRLLLDHLDLAIGRLERGGGALALLHVDIDRFGLVNQSLGRAAGDEVLRRIAKRLEGLGQTQVVAREMADEFLVVLELSLHSTGGATALGAATAHAVAEAVLDAVEAPLELEGRRLQLGAHVGASMLPGDAADAEGLLDHAEAALREGQRTRSRVYLFKGSVANEDGLSFVTDLRGALTRDEFELHYQPIVELADRKVVGGEALIRWRHPERGLIQPNDFIPLLEDTGMIQAVGRWVVAEALDQAAGWQRDHPGFQTTLNVSLAELTDDGIAARLVNETSRTGVPPSSVTIEITETAAMSDPERVGHFIDEIAEAGFPLAIDDFGTGHSSLSRLWRLPVSILKIDRSFTDEMLRDVGAGAMVATIIRLAEGLGVRVVAEGIETEEQLAFLTEQGCTLGQGYLFSRPVPAADFTSLLVD